MESTLPQLRPRATARIESARAAWSQIVDTLRTEPLTEARKLADEMKRDLELQFPRPERTLKGRRS